MGTDYAKSKNAFFMEVSAKDNSGKELEKAMESLFDNLLTKSSDDNQRNPSLNRLTG